MRVDYGSLLDWIVVGVLHSIHLAFGRDHCEGRDAAQYAKPLKFWQFTVRQFLVLIALAAVLAWLARRIYLDRFGPA